MAPFTALRVLLATLLLFAAVATQPAWAHAQLLATSPADGALVDVAPAYLELRFNEPVSPLAARLIAPDGATIDLLSQTQGGGAVTVALPALGADGTYVLSYRVVSADGHPIGGALVFSVGAVTGAAAAPTTDPASVAALWLGKALLFAGLFFGIGGAAFEALAPLPPAARRGALGLALAGLVVAPLTLGLQGLDALALPLPALFDGGTWAAGLATSYALTAGAATLGFLVAIAALLWHSRLAGILAAAIGALAIALSGHASAAAPQVLTRPMVFLHMAGLLFWIGALCPLAMLLRTPADAAATALARFSRGIPYAVAPLVVSGVTLAIVQMGAPGPAWLGGYGVILAMKLGLLVALFGLALWNRLALTRPALAGEARARRQLRRSIGAEMALVLVILALVAGWRFTPPPRALAEVPGPVAAEPLLLHMMDAEVMVMATLTPGRAGPLAMALDITDIDGMPIAAQAVSVTASAPDLGIGPIRRAAERTAAGWRVADLTLPVAGMWIVAVDIRLSRFELRRLEDAITLP